MKEHNIDIAMMFRRSVLLSMCWLLLMSLPHSYCDFNYTLCNTVPYKCGKLKGIFYPFWGNKRASECGGGDPFKLTCHYDDYTTIQIGSQIFTVQEIIMEDKSMRLGRPKLALDVCSLPYSEDIYNVNPTPILEPSPPVYGMTILYTCSGLSNFNFEYNFTCDDNGLSYYIRDYEREQQINDLSPRCKGRLHLLTDAQVDYYDGGGMDALENIIRHGFMVNYNVSEECGRCLGSEGECWELEDGAGKHIDSCHYCADGSQSHHCSNKNGNNLTKSIISVDGNHLTKRIILLVVASVLIGGFMICITIWCWCSKYMPTRSVKFLEMIKRNQDIESFIKNHGALTLKRYKFSEVKKMTNSFNIRLGHGGFGSVYKGKLITGCPVAVKLLNSSKGNGEDFINEVASISRTSHVNIVSLLGFCFEGQKKALIYEFMSNGSLDKFIYNNGLKITQSLSWDNLWQISKGVARGLEYLHRGCSTRILHFDIKPHNILLDDKFCPKISDFGLAKLCPRNESIISMSDQRGTVGYVAPEVWNRHFGGISYKSDVYSYGMMLLEMVGGRKNINAEATNTSEIYFPHWVYKRLDQGEDLRPHDEVIAIEENEIAKRMTIVGLWCVQTFPKDRPTMSRVIDMLEGSMDSLEMPPKPALSSPTRSVPESSTS